MHELKRSCGTVCNGGTKRNIISRLIIAYLLEQPHIQKNTLAVSTGYTAKLSQLKIGSMIKKVRESLEINMEVVSMVRIMC